MANCAGAFRYFAEMARDEAGKVAGRIAAGVAFVYVMLSLVNLHYFGFYKTPIDSLVFGLVEDDTVAVLQTIWRDFPVIWRRIPQTGAHLHEFAGRGGESEREQLARALLKGATGECLRFEDAAANSRREAWIVDGRLERIFFAGARLPPREWLAAAFQRYASAFGNPAFFTPRTDVWAAAGWTSPVFAQSSADDWVEAIDNYVADHLADIVCFIPRPHSLWEDLFGNRLITDLAFESSVPLLSLPLAAI